MIKIDYEDIVTSTYMADAIIRDDFPGFKEDYLVVHCLLKKYKPNRLVEIGTSTGVGTNIICNAVGLSRFLFWKNKGIKVYSIDVPPGTDQSILYPDAEDGHPERAGAKCKYPYVQLYGNSVDFDFSPYYPIDAWFIDGKHNYEYAMKDTAQALLSGPFLLMWHDVQIEEVGKAVIDVMDGKKEFELFRVGDTRVACAIKRTK